MAITYARVTGKVELSGGYDGLRIELAFTPQTSRNVLTFVGAGGGTQIGPVIVETDDDGNLPGLADPAVARIPTNSDQAPVLWKVTARLLVDQTGIPATLSLGTVAIEADTTIAVLLEGQTGVTVVDGTLVINVQALVAIAVAAQQGAEAAKDLAEQFVLADLGTTDGQTAALIGIDSSLTYIALADVAITKGHSDVVGARPGPLVEIGNESNKATFHLLAGEGFTGPYLIGLGADHDDAVAQTISLKADNNIGLGINLEDTSSGGYGLLGSQLSTSGVLIELRKGAQQGGALLSLRNDYGSDVGDLLEWGTSEGLLSGYIDALGALVVQDTALVPHITRIGPSGGGNKVGFYQYSGTPGLYFPSAITTAGNFTNLQAGPASALGSEGLTTLFKWGNSNQLGFFGAAAGQIGGLPADATDLASALTLVNAIKHDLAIGFGFAAA